MSSYTPVTPSKDSIDELKKIIEKDYGKKITDQEAFEIANGCLNYFNLLMYMDDKDRQAMEFEYPEDEKFFASLLCGGNVVKLRSQYMFQFDLRDAVTKRNVFNSLKKEIMREVLKSKQKQCELKLVSECNNDKLVLDHIIPLSSNELNKHLRGMKVADGKKVPSQSFGSNHPSNFLLACEACNNHKKHRFVRKTESAYEIVIFK